MILVRHALPAFVPGEKPRDWELGDEGRAAARALSLPPGPLFASDEPKAVQTVEHLGPVTVDVRLGEVERPWIEDGYRDAAMRYLRDGADGWEPRDHALARISSVLAELPADAIAVTHGLVMSLYVASVHDVDVVAFWSELRFPDAWSIDPLARV